MVWGGSRNVDDYIRFLWLGMMVSWRGMCLFFFFFRVRLDFSGVGYNLLFFCRFLAFVVFMIFKNGRFFGGGFRKGERFGKERDIFL